MMDTGQPMPKLSRAILEMKFMKRSKERVEKELEDAEGQAMYSNDITEEMRKGGKYAVIEVSMNVCKDLIEGRLSFGGMNPEVERMMVVKNSKKVEKMDREKETEISDADLAKQYSVRVQSSAKTKQDRKKNTGNNKRKFLKPMEME